MTTSKILANQYSQMDKIIIAFFTLLAGATAAITWCLKVLVYNVARTLLRANEEDISIKKAQTDLESSDARKYVHPSPNDDRSPCPALNTMANHGYLPRSGRNITGPMLVHALQHAYNFSLPLALVLTYGGFILFGQAGPISLADLARHNRIEHNASLLHRDTEEGQMYAPREVDEELWRRLVEGIENPKEGWGVRDIARIRVRREEESGGHTVPQLAKTNARGEAAAVLHVFGRDVETKSADTGEARVERKVPLDVLTSLFHDERLPDGWKPSEQATLLGVMKTIRSIGTAMDEVRAHKI